jgi:hypothetical protein
MALVTIVSLMAVAEINCGSGIRGDRGDSGDRDDGGDSGNTGDKHLNCIHVLYLNSTFERFDGVSIVWCFQRSIGKQNT